MRLQLSFANTSIFRFEIKNIHLSLLSEATDPTVRVPFLSDSHPFLP
jgi:hypothetical protein